MIYHWIALIFFASAFTFYWVSVRRKFYLSRRQSYPLLFGGFLALTLFLVARGMQIHACPTGNPFEILTFIIWSSVFFYLVVGLLLKVNYLGFFTSGLSSLILLFLLVLPDLNYEYGSEYIHSSHLVGFHASLAVFSYGFFALSSLLGLMYLVQFYGLTQHRAGRFFSILPPLVKLESLQVWILSAGVFALSVSLFVGSFSFFREIGDIPFYKLITTLAVWLFYVVILLLKLLNRMVSSRFAWMTLVGFALALIALIPVDRARHETVRDVLNQVEE